ncbi:branched-chain amino acid ABC transporter permease [Kerstersia similis]|uniref:branched-chain amino acid ABC transporter permease n=1 Tax=Kerstersia similis TaxID=206505 RepID=UPI0039EF8644
MTSMTPPPTLKPRSLTPATLLLRTAAALAAGLLVATQAQSAMLLSLLTQATIFAIFALGVGLLLRQNGMVSFGHAAFYGLAGYVAAILMQQHGLSAEAVLFLTLLIMALFSCLIGLVIVRVPGIAFGMLTLAVGQMFFQLASTSRSLTGGADGMYLDWPARLFGVPIGLIQRQDVLFGISWTLLVLCIAGLAALLSTRFGRVTEAIRDNEERARFIGIRTLMPRVAIFALSALVTSLAGLLSVLNTGFISPESLHWSVSGAALMMVIIGGFRTLWGPALGAVVFFLARDLIGDYAQHWLAIFGTALILIIVFSPEGIGGALQRLFQRRRPQRT